MAASICPLTHCPVLLHTLTGMLPSLLEHALALATPRHLALSVQVAKVVRPTSCPPSQVGIALVGYALVAVLAFLDQ